MRLLLSMILSLWCVFVSAGQRVFRTTDNVDLYYSVSGTGPYCLYVHGGPGAGSHWMEMLMGVELEKRFTMVYLDQRGSARSGSPSDGNYSMDRLVADFEELRGEIGADSWFTLGHSFGGILQMGYWERFPEVIDGMIMSNCTLHLERSILDSWIPKAAELLGEEIDTRELFDPDQDPVERLSIAAGMIREHGLHGQMFYKNEEERDIMDRTFDAVPTFNSDMSDQALLNEEYREDYLVKTQYVTCPVLFFYGTRDWPIGADHYRHTRFPNALIRGEEISHSPFISDAPLLLKAIDDYIGGAGVYKDE